LTIDFAEFAQEAGMDAQRALFDDAFPEHRGTGPASVDHYRWKFHGAPACPPSYEFQASENRRMLGYYAAIPYPYSIDGRGMTVGMVCDVMTSTAARGRGVFTQLGAYALSRLHEAPLDFVTGYPIRPEVMGGHLRVGWKVAFELPMYLRPLRSNAILASRHLSGLAPIVNVGVSAFGALSAPRPSGDTYVGQSSAPAELLDLPEFAVFLERWAESVRNHLVKTPAFYAWRLGAPDAHYDAFLVRRGDEIVCAAIGRAATLHRIPSYALLDVMFVEGEGAALTTLYQEIDHAARRAGVEAVVVMMSREQARRHALRRFGFLRSPFAFKLIIRSVSDSLDVDSISAEADWHLMWIDSDDL
jgi:hypothetical protein